MSPAGFSLPQHPYSAPLQPCALARPAPGSRRAHPGPGPRGAVSESSAPRRPSRPRGRCCGGTGRAAGAGRRAEAVRPGAPGAERRAPGRHGVAVHQPPLLPGAALEPAGPLRRGGAADPAQLLGPRERGAGPGQRRLAQGPVPRRRPGPRPGRAAHSVPAGLRRVDGARGAQRCAAGARAWHGQPQGQAPRVPWPGHLRASHRRRGRGCSGDHVVQTGIPGLDWGEAAKIYKGETRHSHHHPQLWMGPQPWGQLPGP
ncbi:MAP6 domain-containing protein 1 isoform X1 [Manis pentadactyla]|uniref:MAP6 domain-containing protein 1 isoform X1 n=1 Tax=Manis pentadactyla TaxID=143292 RepID=UPI00255CB05F|nr:MAP6 domain-containing protein 1 isoform X1 [Manis pentadactyla]